MVAGALSSEGLTILPFVGPLGSGKPFKHHVGDDVLVASKAQVVYPCGIIGSPSGCPDNGTDLEVKALFFHVKINGVKLASFLASVPVILGHGRRHDIALGKGHVVGKIGGLATVHAKVVLVGNL